MSIISLINIVTHHFLLVVSGIIGLGFLIGFHELGHFLFCKLFAISTPSFSIGFGPKLFSKKIGETEFALSAIPLGGYVEIAGVQEVGQGDQNQAQRNDEYSFRAKPYYQKMLVLAGGILFNLAFAYIALVLLFLTGIPKTPLLFPLNSTTTIENVMVDGPAEKGGLKSHDQIIALNGTPVLNNAKALLSQLEPKADKPVIITIKRNETEQELQVTIGSRLQGGKAVGVLGVEFELQEIEPKSFIEAIKEGISLTNDIIVNTFSLFKNMIQRKTINGLGGPVMVIAQTAQGAAKGFKVFLLLLAIISINLAVINVIPLPILDGGQALFYTIEAIIRRPISDNARIVIHYITWLLLFALILYLTFKDTQSLYKLFNK